MNVIRDFMNTSCKQVDYNINGNVLNRDYI